MLRMVGIITLCIGGIWSPPAYVFAEPQPGQADISTMLIASELELPAPTGPFGVGRVAYHWTDKTRPEPLSSHEGALRELMVYVWYPLETSKGGAPAPYLPDFSTVEEVISKSELERMFRPAAYASIRQLGLPHTHTIDRAKIRPRAGKYPVIIFSHGWGNTTLLYTAELEDLVSHGYVIAAIDHTYDTTFSVFPNRRVVPFAQEKFDNETKKPQGYVNYAKQRVEVMASDTSFVLNQLALYDKKPSLGAPFAGHLDLRRIGALGHSIGGLASVRACQIDPRIRACINQDSDVDNGAPFILTTPAGMRVDQPLLFFAVNADKFSDSVVNPTAEQLAQMKLTRAEFDALIQRQQRIQNDALASVRGGSYRVIIDIPSVTHRSFSDLTLLAASGDKTKMAESLHNYRIIQSYTRAFFDKYLKGKKDSLLEKKTSPDSRVRVDRFSYSSQ